MKVSYLINLYKNRQIVLHLKLNQDHLISENLLASNDIVDYYEYRKGILHIYIKHSFWNDQQIENYIRLREGSFKYDKSRKE